MFKIFNNNPVKKLQKKHSQLLKEAFDLSKVSRQKSDEKIYEAEQIARKIQELKHI